MTSQQHPSDSPGKFGLRYEDMSEEELEYYREFWQEPAPAEGEPGYRIPEAHAVKARIRMAYGLSFTLLSVGVLCTFLPLVLEHLMLASLGGLVVLAGLGLLVAVRRRLFRSLRVPGEAPVEKNRRAKWFWLPHSFVIAGVLTAVVAIAVIPQVFAGEEPNLIRAHAALWTEITLLVWLMAALFYGLIALSVYTPDDPDEALIRPTDFAERQLEKDLAKGRRGDDDFYDSSWITRR